jgi:hypothetical protein
LKGVAQQAAQQGKQLADQTKAKAGEQQAKRAERWADDPDTVWFGESKDVTAKATGMSKAHYRITRDRIWVESGLFGTRSESVPLWAVRDLDVRQNVMQRGKDIGDVVLHLEDPAYATAQVGAFDLGGLGEPGGGRTSGEVVLDNIEGPYAVRDLLGPLVSEARAKKLRERQTQYLNVGHAAVLGGAAAAPPAPAAPPVDVADQLRKLAELRDQGILSEEEFADQKRRLLGT